MQQYINKRQNDLLFRMIVASLTVSKKEEKKKQQINENETIAKR